MPIRLLKDILGTFFWLSWAGMNAVAKNICVQVLGGHEFQLIWVNRSMIAGS